LFLVAVLPAPGVPAQEREPAPAPFTWKATYREGLEAARRRRRLLLLYLPPAGDRPEPAVLAHAARQLGSPPAVEGVRIGSADVEAILQRFAVRKLPVLLLLDRRENVVARWEGEAPAGLWTTLRQAVRRQEEREAGEAREAEEARRLALAGKLDAAYRKAEALRRSPLAAPESEAAARDVLGLVEREGERALMRTLAREGLASDSELREGLREVRRSAPHPATRAAIDREINRLERGVVGAGAR
jgi:phosphoglycolate phosphatase-like HAD superfamily hydrolase